MQVRDLKGILKGTTYIFGVKVKTIKTDSLESLEKDMLDRKVISIEGVDMDEESVSVFVE